MAVSRSLCSFTIDGLKLVSEANAHEFWRARQKRAKSQRETGLLHMKAAMGRRSWDGSPLVVTITRIAPRELDSDNAVGSAKHLRDSIADALGVDDRDKRITWVIEQRKGGVREYAAEVRVELALMGAA